MSFASGSSTSALRSAMRGRRMLCTSSKNLDAARASLPAPQLDISGSYAESSTSSSQPPMPSRPSKRFGLRSQGEDRRRADPSRRRDDGPTLPPMNVPEVPDTSLLTTGASARAYLTDLFKLPSSHAFPPDLALQMLTHKSYRNVHIIKHWNERHSRRDEQWYSDNFDHGHGDAERSIETGGNSLANHGGRLEFIGRRALSAYLAMFLHSSFASLGVNDARDFPSFMGNSRSLDNKINELRELDNLGLLVGDKWRLMHHMRWDTHNPVTRAGRPRIQGSVVEAILGGIFTQLGSPAAQRAFHLNVLPHLAVQFRDQRLIRKIEELRVQAEQELHGVAGVVGETWSASLD